MDKPVKVNRRRSMRNMKRNSILLPPVIDEENDLSVTSTDLGIAEELGSVWMETNQPKEKKSRRRSSCISKTLPNFIQLQINGTTSPDDITVNNGIEILRTAEHDQISPSVSPPVSVFDISLTDKNILSPDSPLFFSRSSELDIPSHESFHNLGNNNGNHDHCMSSLTHSSMTHIPVIENSDSLPKAEALMKINNFDADKSLGDVLYDATTQSCALLSEDSVFSIGGTHSSYIDSIQSKTRISDVSDLPLSYTEGRRSSTRSIDYSDISLQFCSPTSTSDTTTRNLSDELISQNDEGNKERHTGSYVSVADSDNVRNLNGESPVKSENIPVENETEALTITPPVYWHSSRDISVETVKNRINDDIKVEQLLDIDLPHCEQSDSPTDGDLTQKTDDNSRVRRMGWYILDCESSSSASQKKDSQLQENNGKTAQTDSQSTCSDILDACEMPSNDEITSDSAINTEISLNMNLLEQIQEQVRESQAKEKKTRKSRRRSSDIFIKSTMIVEDEPIISDDENSSITRKLRRKSKPIRRAPLLNLDFTSNNDASSDRSDSISPATDRSDSSSPEEGADKRTQKVKKQRKRKRIPDTSIEDIYKNKNYRKPVEKLWETIFESPTKLKHEQYQSSRRFRRAVQFETDPRGKSKKRLKKAAKLGWTTYSRRKKGITDIEFFKRMDNMDTVLAEND